MGVYILDGYTIISHVPSDVQNMNDKTKKWHSRLSHLSERSLVELVKHELLWREKLNNLELCDKFILDEKYKMKF